VSPPERGACKEKGEEKQQIRSDINPLPQAQKKGRRGDYPLRILRSKEGNLDGRKTNNWVYSKP